MPQVRGVRQGAGAVACDEVVVEVEVGEVGNVRGGDEERGALIGELVEGESQCGEGEGAVEPGKGERERAVGELVVGKVEVRELMEVATLEEEREGVIGELEVAQGEVLEDTRRDGEGGERLLQTSQVDAGVVEVERMEVREMRGIRECMERVVADRLASQIEARGAGEEERGVGQLTEAVGGEAL